jgi:hypothetical protein
MVLSPAGAALVFTQVLIREVSALSRAGLTHDGLGRVLSFVPGRRLARLLGESRVDAYWAILAVNCVISVLAFLVATAGGDQGALGRITGVMSLVVYASPAVVLVAFDRAPERYVTLSRGWRVLARVAFAGIGVIFFLAGWRYLWEALVALLIACAALFLLPTVSARRRWYVATSHAAGLLRVRTDSSAQAAVIWLGYFTVLWLLSRVGIPGDWQFAAALLVAVISVAVFERLVVLSRRYMADVPPSDMPRLPRTADLAADPAVLVRVRLPQCGVRLSPVLPVGPLPDCLGQGPPPAGVVRHILGRPHLLGHDEDAVASKHLVVLQAAPQQLEGIVFQVRDVQPGRGHRDVRDGALQRCLPGPRRLPGWCRLVRNGVQPFGYRPQDLADRVVDLAMPAALPERPQELGEGPRGQGTV